jgi:hypothetical protein
MIAGDLGGYYGLFLGGSAISIFEILDLIIYNALIKLTTRRRLQLPNRIEPSPQIHVLKELSLESAESTEYFQIDADARKFGYLYPPRTRLRATRVPGLPQAAGTSSAVQQTATDSDLNLNLEY